MTTVVELELPAAHLGLERTFDRVPSFEFQLTGSIGDSPPLVYASGPDRGAIESAISADDSVDLLASLDDASDDRWLFRLEFGRQLKVFQRIVAEHEGIILDARGQDARWSVELLFHDRAAVSNCHALIGEYDFQAEVTRVSAVNGHLSEHTPLTKIQYETILKAHELGYFDVPRQVTLEELAAELDVSHQALSERIRRSHAALISAELSNRLTPMGANT
ncbi:helix-turn-helix domain-containing protein [Halobacteria archaeon AArc-dxtr1]|nr:helix-turn-helix domain-containing protein [Halobacteria archaeon AArc-dxtr1]